MDITLFAIVIILLAVIAWRLFHSEKSTEPQDSQSLLLIQDRLEKLSQTLDVKLSESTDKTFARANESAKMINDVMQNIMQELGKVKEGQQQVLSVADTLKNLQDILRNPKQRGTHGEIFLGMELDNILPPGTYETQHYFKDGTAVDVAIKTPNGKIIPVDSKFSLENYQRMLDVGNNPADRERYETAFANDLKVRIDETAKYIKPDEETLDFAFMFIPSEAMYYDLLNRKVGIRGDVDLIEYAFTKKRVIIVSPTTLIAYLQTVVLGLQALRIEENAKKIGDWVRDLGKHLSGYQEHLQRMGKNLGITVSSYNTARQEFGKIDKDISRITNEKFELESPVIEKPEENSDQLL
jgi:DNA recombination protein RmuC